MFYDLDSEGNMVDVGGNIMVPRHAVQQYMSAMRLGHQPQYGAHDLGSFEVPTGFLGVQAPGRQNPTFAQPHGSHLSSPASPSQMPGAHGNNSNNGASHSSGGGGGDGGGRMNSSGGESPLSVCLFRPRPTDQAAASGDRTGLTGSSTSNPYRSVAAATAAAAALPSSSPSVAGNAYSSAPTSALAPNPSGGWLPQEFQTSLGFHGSTTFAADSHSTAWLSQQHAANEAALVYDHSHISPQPPSRQPTPSIRVTTEFAGPGQDFSQPQDALYSASSPSSLPPDTSRYNNQYSGHLSPHTPYSMPQDAENMQTPVSPVSGHNSPHEAALAEQQISRKRSHSIMSQQDTQSQPYPVTLQQPPLHHHQQHHHSRSGSIVSATGASPHDVTDELPYSPRGSRAFKRGDPPTNEHNKYICDYGEECIGLTFDRKCEWSKHMDKHDRPYRCPHPSCAKLQGFTYSGGLLRHEREVHGKHGGPKAQLMCPHTDCKRHTGKGFTRKENLNEHLRRVHPKDGFQQQDSQLSQIQLLRRDTTDLSLLGEDAENSANRMPDSVDHEDFMGASPVLGKRKRMLTDGMGDDRDEEIKRLRAELEAERAERLRLEADTYRYQDDIRRLQGDLMQAQEHSQQSQQPVPEATQA